MLGAFVPCGTSPTTDPTVTPESGKFFTTSPLDGEVYDKLIVWLIAASDIPALDARGGKSDVTVRADISGREPVPPRLADSGLNKCDFGTEKDVSQLLNWDRKRSMLFKRGGADTFNLHVYDGDLIDLLAGKGKSNELLTFSSSLPSTYGVYVRTTLPFKGGKGSMTFAIKLERAESHIVSAADIAAFPMEYETFSNGDAQAVLAHHRSAKNTKAVLWLPGRGDAFFHPHVGRTFDAAGFDVYVLHYHNVGVCRRLRLYQNPYLTSHIASGSMDEYVAEIATALEMIKSAKKYSSVLGYAHSTGAPILCNYLQRNGDAGFDGLVLNSPFFDWGAVGGEIVETVLERGVPWLARCGLQRYTDPFGPFTPDSPNTYAAKIQADYAFDPRDRPLFLTPTTVGFILAVNKIQAELRALSQPLTRKPVLLLASKSDNVLMWDEIVTIIHKVADEQATDTTLFTANAHDVFISPDKVDTDAALVVLRNWLATKAPGHGADSMLGPKFCGC